MSGPYVITTGKRFRYEDANVGGVQVESRRAVATPEEMRKALLRIDDSLYATAMALPDSGGTVGPLPDGTVIEVERVTHDDLIAACPDVDWYPIVNGPASVRRARILDAYNARQEQP